MINSWPNPIGDGGEILARLYDDHGTVHHTLRGAFYGPFDDTDDGSHADEDEAPENPIENGDNVVQPVVVQEPIVANPLMAADVHQLLASINANLSYQEQRARAQHSFEVRTSKKIANVKYAECDIQMLLNMSREGAEGLERRRLVCWISFLFKFPFPIFHLHPASMNQLSLSWMKTL